MFQKKLILGLKFRHLMTCIWIQICEFHTDYTAKKFYYKYFIRRSIEKKFFFFSIYGSIFLMKRIPIRKFKIKTISQHSQIAFQTDFVFRTYALNVCVAHRATLDGGAALYATVTCRNKIRRHSVLSSPFFQCSSQ